MGRALAIGGTTPAAGSLFQSSPAHMGRALSADLRYADLRYAVSILARPHGAGALRFVPNGVKITMFQSSPAHMGRALSKQTGVAVARVAVSILARPHGAGARTTAP